MSDFLRVQLEEEEQKPGMKKQVVFDKDGKPCKNCSSFKEWAKLPKKKVSGSLHERQAKGIDCPADVNELGSATWTFLHSMAAQYPNAPDQVEQSEMRTFMRIFSRVYPCWHCADDFQDWMRQKGNEPRVENREQFGKWLCRAHNEVNVKLGKPKFNCNLWKQRWRDGCDERLK